MSLDPFAMFLANLSKQLGPYWKDLFGGLSLDNPVVNHPDANTFLQKGLYREGYISRDNVSFLLWVIVRKGSSIPETTAHCVKALILDFHGKKPWEPIKRLNKETYKYDEIPGLRQFLKEYYENTQTHEQREEQPSGIVQVQQSLEQIEKVLQQVKAVFAKELISIEILRDGFEETDLPCIGIKDPQSKMVTMALVELIKKLDSTGERVKCT